MLDHLVSSDRRVVSVDLVSCEYRSEISLLGIRLRTKHSPFVHIVVFAAPSPVVVREPVDLLHLLSREGGRSSNDVPPV